MARKIIKKFNLKSFLLYSMWGIFIFALSIYFTFPFQKLKPIIEDLVSKNSPYIISIKTLDSHYFTGIALNDLKLKKEKQKTEGDLVIIQDLSIWLNPIPLLWGKKSLSINAKLNTGIIKGSIKFDDESLYLDLALIAVPLSNLLILKESFDINLGGKLNGNIEFDTIFKDVSKTTGLINLNSKNLTLDQLSIMTALGNLDFKDLKFSKFNLNSDINEGKTIIKKLEIDGDSLSGNATGNIKLAKIPAKSPIDITIDFKVLGDLEKRFGMILDQFFPSKTEAGFYKLTLQGTLFNPIPAMDNFE
ncbi:MAG: type II secretion system protein GspN [Pseudomonadota bacterium]